MEVRKYLKTAEDVLALKDTDAKIYEKGYEGGYFKFVKGTLCRFSDDNKIIYFNPCIDMDEEVYTIEEELAKEATEEDVNRLCWFWDSDFNDKRLCILDKVCSGREHPYQDTDGYSWRHCYRLMPSDVAELTGYEVKLLTEKKK